MTETDLKAERDSLREQVTQLHRAKLAGDVLAGVAHDLNSALTGLVWCCEALQKRVQDDPDLANGLGDFVGGAHYARSLAQRLIQLGRQQDTPQADLSFEELIKRCLELVEMLRPRNVTVQVSLEARGARLWANETQLQQAVLNMASNAFDAMREVGGTLTLRTLREAADGGDSSLVLYVQDTGVGMPPSVTARVFEPFFSTKGPGAGTGLGLAVVRNVAQNHGGSVTVRSEEGVGTCLEMRLPELTRKGG